MKKIFLGFVALFVLTASVFSNTLIGESVGRVVLTTDKLSDLDAYSSKIKKGDVICVKNLLLTRADRATTWIWLGFSDNYGRSTGTTSVGNIGNIGPEWIGYNDYGRYCLDLINRCYWKRIKITAYFIKQDHMSSTWELEHGYGLQAINVPLD